MSPLVSLALLIPLAYVAGSVPFGLLVGLSRGKDVRLFGSGNIGATNVGRMLGVKFFALVFVLDLLKGLLPMLAGGYVVHARLFTAGGPAVDPWLVYLVWLLVGFAAVFGHMYSLFLHFKGGKGVATSAGIVLGLWPYYTVPGLIALAAWVVLFVVTRYVSIASMGAAVIFALAYVAVGLGAGWPIFGQQLPLLGFAALVAVMIVYKHRDNVTRLRAGTEHRMGRRRNDE